MRKRGGQPGNKNALGNRGGGAPVGNQNSRKHGAYGRLWPLSDEEMEMIGTMPFDPEQLLKDEIALLTVREHRILRLIAQYDSEQMVVSEVKRSEERREFADEAEQNLYAEIVRSRNSCGDSLPGHAYHLFTTSESPLKIILLLEGVLSRIMDEKRRAIDSLIRYQRDTGQNDTSSVADDWVQAVIESEAG